MGLLVVFEGIDGVGKTYMIEKVEPLLKSNRIKLDMIKFPSADIYGSRIREIISGHEGASVSYATDMELMLLYALDMHRCLHTSILPMLGKGGLVIMDRYIHSLLAYQGAMEELWDVPSTLSKLRVETLVFDVVSLKRPDLVFWIDQDISEVPTRDNIEKRGISFRQSVNEKYQVMYDNPEIYGDIHKISRNDTMKVVDHILDVFLAPLAKKKLDYVG